MLIIHFLLLIIFIVYFVLMIYIDIKNVNNMNEEEKIAIEIKFIAFSITLIVGIVFLYIFL